MFNANNHQDVYDLLFRLLAADREEKVEEALRSTGLWDNKASWRLLGDKEDNYATIGAQAVIPEAAVAEKITNAIDAVLIRCCRERGIDPKGPDAPTSVRRAVASFFDVNPDAAHSGSLEVWDARKIREVARSTTSIVLTGDRRKRVDRKRNYPSVTILDRGEGQTPEMQPVTLLSLGDSLKRDIAFTHGKFAMGGTAALRFCGDKHFQLVLSRRAPTLAAEDGDSSDWGFTIVRRDYQDGDSMTAYRYLAPLGVEDHPGRGDILRIPARSLPIGPRYNKPYEVEVESGTLIKLYQYQTDAVTQFGQTGGLRQELDAWMPQLPLPIRLHECRWQGELRSTEWNLTGLNRRLKEAEPEYDATGTLTVWGEPFTYRIFCLEGDNAKRYRGDQGVVFAVNGQSHGMLHKRLFGTKAVGLGALEDALAVVIDCTEVSVPSLEDLTQNSRDRLSESQFRKEVEDKIKQLLADDARLRQLNRERADRRLGERLSDDRPLEEVLRQVMRRSQVLNALFLRGQRLANQSILQASSQGDCYKGQPHPTEFRFLRLPYGEVLERNCHLGQRTRIDFATDVEDDYFDRAILPGSLDVRISREGNPVESSEYTYVMRLSSGIAHLSIDLPPSVVEGDQLIVVVQVNDEALITPLVNTACISVLPEQRTRSGDGGRNRRGSGNARLSLTPSGIEFPQINEIREERWKKSEMDERSALRVVNLGKDEGSNATRYLFEVNMDNMYLKAERRSTPRRKDILDAQWKYGLVLLGLGLLREPQETTSENDEQFDERKRIAATSDAIGPVLLPLINELGEPGMGDLISS